VLAFGMISESFIGGTFTTIKNTGCINEMIR
jgi:hypothetical protein